MLLDVTANVLPDTMAGTRLLAMEIGELTMELGNVRSRIFTFIVLFCHIHFVNEIPIKQRKTTCSLIPEICFTISSNIIWYVPHGADNIH